MGIQAFLDLLKERIDKFKECTYIITHKDSAIKNATGEILVLKKENGFTYKGNKDDIKV